MSTEIQNEAAAQRLTVGGMTCNGCVRRVTDVIAQGGAAEVKVTLETGVAEFKATDAQRAAIRTRLDDDGWDVGA